MWNVFNFNNFDDKFKNLKNEKETYTHEDLRYYFEKLVKINLNNVNINNFIELLRKITQITIWGDKYDDQIFQYFCEDNIFNHFIYLLRQKINKNIRVQIYQSLTLLIQNLQKDISLYYIFSNNKINNLIYTTFIYQDEEIMPYYISMIKSISFFLNYHTSKFFFNEKSMKFPLYTESLRLYKFNDIITRTYVKNIILNILKIEDEGIENLILLRSAFFTVLVCYLRNHLIRMNKIYAKIKESVKLRKLFNTYLDEMDDVLYFFEDMLNCEKKRINDMLVVKLLLYFYFPIISSFHSSIYFDKINTDREIVNLYTHHRNDEEMQKREENCKTVKEKENFGSIDYVYFSNGKGSEGEVSLEETTGKAAEEAGEKAGEKAAGQSLSSSHLPPPPHPLASIERDRYDSNVPFLRLIDGSLKNCKNFDFCKSLSSSNESSVNSNMSYSESREGEHPEVETTPGGRQLVEENACGDHVYSKKNDENSVNIKNNNCKKKGKKGDNTYEFLYFRGRSNLKKEKSIDGKSNQQGYNKNGVDGEEGEVDTVASAQAASRHKDSSLIRENELNNGYFRKRRKRKIYIQLSATSGILHRKRSGKAAAEEATAKEAAAEEATAKEATAEEATAKEAAAEEATAKEAAAKEATAKEAAAKEATAVEETNGGDPYELQRLIMDENFLKKMREEFENFYSLSIEELLPEYNKDEETVFLSLINGYYGEVGAQVGGETGAQVGGDMGAQVGGDMGGKTSGETGAQVGGVGGGVSMKKYNELSNPILLNFLLLTNVQKEKNIKKCEKDNMKNKISDLYFLLSIQFVYNFIQNFDGDLSDDLVIPFFKISEHNFVYVFWNVVNVHINNLYLRIISLKLLINLTLLYIGKIANEDKRATFSTPLLNMIAKIKKKLANKIKSIIGKMEYKVCQIFWEECKIYENCAQEKINICRDSILINVVNDVDESGENNFLCYPISQIEIYRRNVHTLFVLEGVSNKLQRIVSSAKSEISSMPFDFSYNNATALIDIKNKNTIKCYLKNNNKIFNCYYIEDDANFLLCVPSNSHVNQALIIFSYPLMLIDLYIDKNDNKKLIIHVYSYNNEENNNVEDSSVTNFNNSEKIFNNNTFDSNYVNPMRCYSSNNDDSITDDNTKTHKNDYILNKYSSTYKKNKTITNMKKEWCHKELNFMKNVLKLNFYDTTRSLIVYKELKSGIQHINDKYKKKLEEYLSTF
ncbi:hypothetical protein POVWA2_036770 [Plasmodium ovale wallikeri]|uniref:FPL domain-containing protein n=1 Tax=Plasmodium ovale wallikeri TaxID=864142 RepID=A0A1A8Z552_PLAOA|nr:hypothetical protein POVWA2_036770 [Plasmodium ovale wallikeri]